MIKRIKKVVKNTKESFRRANETVRKTQEEFKRDGKSQ